MKRMHASRCLVTLGEVLAELADEIEALGVALCLDPGIVARHVGELQAIDLIAQTQRALAGLIEAGLTDQAVEAIDIEALRQRFPAVAPAEAGKAAHHPKNTAAFKRSRNT